MKKRRKEKYNRANGIPLYKLNLGDEFTFPNGRKKYILRNEYANSVSVYRSLTNGKTYECTNKAIVFLV